MGSEGTTSSSGGGDSSSANVVLTMTPMQAKALATLIGRSARRGSGLDVLRIALIRGSSEVNSREPSSAASALAETKAFVAGAQAEVAAARAKRAQTASHVPKAILAKYDRIRGRRGEQAIFALRGPSCGHCDTAIPLQRRNQMIGTGQIEVCEACGVLLYATQ